MKVLIVDDEPMITMDLAALLMDAGHDISGTATTVEAAMSLLRVTQCDAVVLDANLEGLSAEPIAEELITRGIPFLVLSGLSKDRLSSAMAKGVFCPKPYHPSKIVIAVGALAARELQHSQPTS